MRRRDFMKAAFAFTAAAASGTAYGKEQEKPNIVLINIDDMGWRDIGVNGSDFYRTPNIDSLVRSGMNFSSAYAAAANCAPSRACLLSGKYTPRHGVYTVGSSERGKSKYRKLIPTKNKKFLDEDETTIADCLKDAGYRTITLGKYHVNSDPLKHGFDENVGGCHKGHPPTYFSPYSIPTLEDGPKGEHLPERLTDEALEFIDRNKNRPFFLYFPFYSVHSPIEARDDLLEKYKNYEPGELHKRADYAAMIEAVDIHIGRLIEKIDKLNLREKTMIIFTADNGGVHWATDMAPLRGCKGSYYEGGIREPLAFSWKGRISPGTTCDVPVSQIDFFPTFLSIVGAKPPKGKILDGKDISPLLFGHEKLFDKQRPLFWHFPIYLQGGDDETRDPLFRTRPGSVVRKGDWKLHEYFEDGELELYNLKTDIGESKDLSELYPQKTKELYEILCRWREKTNADIPKKLNPKYDRKADLKARKS
ncbi:sulfatase [Sedimentisphaera salicampi]|uniref:Arylsulfatase n=1 Tax=Sedimentisphaera salicampi TaxID=1941349 RepID=A0A1W6LND6_9BACT|nr:sulfatase [Sedimentisphaera salicampi]ARN57287.1 Arylsulfatase [Sedimentisphaera salicampi]